MCQLYFLSLEHCVLTLCTVFSHYTLAWRCYLPALSDTMTVLSCPFLLQIRYQKLPKEANSSTKHSRVCIYCICRALPSPRALQLSVPPLYFKNHFGAAVLSFSGDLDWNKWAADGKLAGGHTGGVAVTGMIDWGTVGGSREEKGVSRKVPDGFVSHIIDWITRWAYRDNQFSLWAGESRAFTRELAEFNHLVLQSEASFKQYLHLCSPSERQQ